MGRGHKWIQDIELSFCEIILDYYYSMIKKKKCSCVSLLLPTQSLVGA